ncbi:MAG: hypothetical protein Kow0019_05850 [Methanobacteriaceae archaeon]
MDMPNLNFMNDAETNLIFGKPIKIDKKLLIPFINICSMGKKESLISSISPCAIFLSEQVKSTENENYLFILSNKGYENQSKLIEFIESKKTTIFKNWGIDINIQKMNIIYPFIDKKNEKINNDFTD